MNNTFLTISLFLAFFFFILLPNCNEAPKGKKEDHVVALTKHWEKAIPHQEIPQGLTSISAASCGACHQQIYEEWKASTHAVAFQDLQFQAEWKKDNVYVCLNCHTPLQNQQEYIVKGLINGDYKTPLKEINPHFDRQLQQESITCATCHIRNGKVIGAIGNTLAPHNTIRDAEFLSEKLCISCHNAVDTLNMVLVCTFETGDEWKNNWASKQSKTCISCHMPETERPLLPGMQKQLSHAHNFPGSGIPKFSGSTVKRLESLEMSESNIRHAYSVGETMNYSLTLKNSFAGHSVPTGDPERFLLVSFQLTDGSGNLLKKEQHRIGEQWEWYPVAQKLSDNNLKPLQDTAYHFAYAMQKAGSLFFEVSITKHRMTEENAKYNGILGKYPLSIVVFHKQYAIRSN